MVVTLVCPDLSLALCQRGFCVPMAKPDGTYELEDVGQLTLVRKDDMLACCCCRKMSPKEASSAFVELSAPQMVLCPVCANMDGVDLLREIIESGTLNVIATRDLGRVALAARRLRHASRNLPSHAEFTMEMLMRKHLGEQRGLIVTSSLFAWWTAQANALQQGQRGETLSTLMACKQMMDDTEWKTGVSGECFRPSRPFSEVRVTSLAITEAIVSDKEDNYVAISPTGGLVCLCNNQRVALYRREERTPYAGLDIRQMLEQVPSSSYAERFWTRALERQSGPPRSVLEHIVDFPNNQSFRQVTFTANESYVLVSGEGGSCIIDVHAQTVAACNDAILCAVDDDGRCVCVERKHGQLLVTLSNLQAPQQQTREVALLDLEQLCSSNDATHRLLAWEPQSFEIAIQRGDAEMESEQSPHGQTEISLSLNGYHVTIPLASTQPLRASHLLPSQNVLDVGVEKTLLQSRYRLRISAYGDEVNDRTIGRTFTLSNDTQSRSSCSGLNIQTSLRFSRRIQINTSCYTSTPSLAGFALKSRLCVCVLSTAS